VPGSRMRGVISPFAQYAFLAS